MPLTRGEESEILQVTRKRRENQAVKNDQCSKRKLQTN